jgi:polyketide synthase 12/myxalamid-type polyketide synthase MxaF
MIATDAKERPALIEKHLRQLIASVLRLNVDRIGARTPFQSLGMDSLMALELRNRLEDKLDARFPATLVWQYPTVAALAEHVNESIEMPEAVAVMEPEPASAKGALDRISEMSDEEVERLFAQRVAKQRI